MKPIRNILIVEDKASNLLVATSSLDLLQYNYIVAVNGNEAIEQFQLFSFELILMDIRMPVLDGIETTKLIRDLEKKQNLARTPVVAMTAEYASGDLKEWEEAGIEDVIPKPFHINYLIKILNRYCKKIGTS